MSDRDVSKLTRDQYMSYEEWLRTLEDIGNTVEVSTYRPPVIKTGLDVSEAEESLFIPIVTCITSFVLFVLIGLIRYWRLFQ
jgi:hypothetical protein